MHGNDAMPITARMLPWLRACSPAWLRNYHARALPQDLLAGAIVAAMLVPQSMAYALLAGLPPQYGMYASMLPLLAYAAFGSSMTLSVGPVAVTSLMTATALAPLAVAGSADYATAAALLALLSGAMLLVFGLLRFGFLATLLSNPVISGFTSGSSLLILIGQLQPLLGIEARGGDVFALLRAVFGGLGAIHGATALVGLCALALLIAARASLAPLARRLRAGTALATTLPKLAPLLVVLAAIALAQLLDLHARFGVAVVGRIPDGLPRFALPLLDAERTRALLFPAFAIALINFVSSISVAQALALKRGERIDADAELRALGAANIASAVTGGFPVNGGFARSLVNFSAGARSPLAGIVSALLMAAIITGAAGLFTALPIAVLAATIIVAVAPVIDIDALRRAWRYDRADALALLATALGVVLLGVEAGIAIGIAVSLASLVWRSGHPHIAELGRVPLTEHFRNVLRYRTETLSSVLALRIDENLLFANAHAVELRVRGGLDARPELRHVLLVLSSVSQIDTTGLEMLLELNRELSARGIDLNFAELKGPVLQRLQNSPLLDTLSGKIFLSTHQAFLSFSGETEDYSI